MPPKPVTIIGAGLAGLTLGRCLKHKGIPAVVFDCVASLPYHNHGITLHPSTYQPLLSILQMEESVFREQLAVDVQQDGIANISSVRIRPEISNDSFRCHRGRLERLLQKEQSIKYKHTLQNLEIHPQSQKIIAVFQNGERIESQYLIGCDGAHSLIRQILAPSIKLKVLPYAVFHGKRHLLHTEYSEMMGLKAYEHVQFQTLKGNIRLEISMSNRTASGVDVSYTFSRPAKDVDDPLYRPDRCIAAAKDIPEAFYQEVEGLRDLDGPFAGIFDGEKVRGDRMLHWLMRSVMPVLDEAHKLVSQGVMLIGDAAHAMPILGGEGANVAIQDAMELAENISLSGWEDMKSFSSSNVRTWKQCVADSEQRLMKMHHASLTRSTFADTSEP